jgi:hypothetical protein
VGTPGEPREKPARRRTGGVSVIAGGLLQDLEDRLRRDLAPIEERVRPGEETRGLAGGAGAAGGTGGAGGAVLANDRLLIVLPGAPESCPPCAEPGVPDTDQG